MANSGTNNITSQNFEAMYDSFDNQAADDFIIYAGPLTISSIEVLGVYYNGSGPAISVNVWFYNDNNGLPGTTADSAMNIVPSGGLSTGSFIIPFQPYITLPGGIFWLSVQCNMDLSAGGQWGWTEQLPNFNHSAWRNPLGGFLTQCLNWGYRVTDCQIGSPPYYDLSFRLNGVALPVELISFTAKASEGQVELNWITATEKNNHGFEVQRSNSGEFETLAFVEGNGTTTETHTYTYTDKDVNVGTYRYRLMQIDYDGTAHYSNVVDADVKIPSVFSLEQNYPNPFNPTTRIDFSLAVDSKVTLKVFNILGQEIAELLNNELTTGTHYVNFDASSLNSGIYFYKIEAAGIDGSSFVDIKKMILLK
jgi:hypothetical protein